MLTATGVSRAQLETEGRRRAALSRSPTAPARGHPLSEGTLGPGCVLTCNWHNWKFDLASGAALVGRDPVRSYPVAERGGKMLCATRRPRRSGRALAGLEAAIADGDRARMAREVARFERAAFDAREAVAYGFRVRHERLEDGMTMPMPRRRTGSRSPPAPAPRYGWRHCSNRSAISPGTPRAPANSPMSRASPNGAVRALSRRSKPNTSPPRSPGCAARLPRTSPTRGCAPRSARRRWRIMPISAIATIYALKERLPEFRGLRRGLVRMGRDRERGCARARFRRAFGRRHPAPNPRIVGASDARALRCARRRRRVQFPALRNGIRAGDREPDCRQCRLARFHPCADLRQCLPPPLPGAAGSLGSRRHCNWRSSSGATATMPTRAPIRRAGGSPIAPRSSPKRRRHSTITGSRNRSSPATG